MVWLSPPLAPLGTVAYVSHWGQILTDDEVLLVEGHAELEDVALFAVRGEVGEHLGGVFARVDLPARLAGERVEVFRLLLRRLELDHHAGHSVDERAHGDVVATLARLAVRLHDEPVAEARDEPENEPVVKPLRSRVEEAHRLLEIGRKVLSEEERIALAEGPLDCDDAAALVEARSTATMPPFLSKDRTFCTISL